MEYVTIKIPKKIVEFMKIPAKEDVEKFLLKELVMRLYEKGIIGAGIAARLLGISKIEFYEILAQEKVPINYTEEELEKDLEMVEKIVRKYRGQ